MSPEARELSRATLISDPVPVSANRSTSREINKKALIDVIHRENGISRAELAKTLGLSKPAVSKNVAELIDLGIVEEKHIGEAGTSGGRRPILLFFNSSHSNIGSVDLSLEEPVCAIGDLNFQIQGMRKIKIDRHASSNKKRQSVVDAFEEILSEKSIPSQKMEIIVISHPGVIGNENKPHIVDERHHDWTEIGLQAHLEKHFGIPVVLENDVGLSALGEVHLGEIRQNEDIIYVKCGIGLGAGVIVDRKLYKGRGGAAGEIGSFITSYGKRVEDVVAMEGLLRHLKELLYQAGRKGDLSFSMAVEMVANGDELVNQGIRQIGQELGRAIYNASIMLDIPNVILGGDYLLLGDAVFEGIEDGMPQTFLTRPTVVASTLKETSGVIGGFVLGKDEIIRQVQIV